MAEFFRATSRRGLTVLLITEFVHGRSGQARRCPHCSAEWRIETDHGKTVRLLRNGTAAQSAILVAFGNNAAVECCRWPNRNRPGRLIGFRNRYGQEVLRPLKGRARALDSASEPQAYVLECRMCDREFGVDRAEIYTSMCPYHQGGRAGIPVER